MYAIVEINGQQFKAEQGKKLFVHHIKDVFLFGDYKRNLQTGNGHNI